MITENKDKFKMTESKNIIDFKNLPSLKKVWKEDETDYDFVEKLKLTSINHSKKIE